jgi:hypothetical protein
MGISGPLRAFLDALLSDVGPPDQPELLKELKRTARRRPGSARPEKIEYERRQFAVHRFAPPLREVLPAASNFFKIYPEEVDMSRGSRESYASELLAAMARHLELRADLGHNADFVPNQGPFTALNDLNVRIRDKIGPYRGLRKHPEHHAMADTTGATITAAVLLGTVAGPTKGDPSEAMKIMVLSLWFMMVADRSLTDTIRTTAVTTFTEMVGIR